jgi:RimJ/RimL family protein N-acetyltransferase
MAGAIPRVDSADSAKRPERTTLRGRYAILEPLDVAKHGESLWNGTGGDRHQILWKYMWDGPFPDRAAFDVHLEAKAASADPLYYAIVDPTTGLATGHAALLRVDPKHRVVEVGSLMFSPELQRSRAATEAMYLLARYVFDDLGYRRYEWKCDALNEPSRRAALRLGFTFEGVFRQHMIVKERNRDTAWFSMLDSEWPSRKCELERWLHPSNFDIAGRQKTALRRVVLESQGGARD